jgi:hypothetical protein
MVHNSDWKNCYEAHYDVWYVTLFTWKCIRPNKFCTVDEIKIGEKANRQTKATKKKQKQSKDKHHAHNYPPLFAVPT